MPDLRTWLESLNLDGYYETFIENRIDSDVLAELTEGDLEKLQIPLGDRKRLLRAVRSLAKEVRGEAPSDRPTTPAAQASAAVESDWSAAARVQGEQLRHLTMMFVDLVGSTALSEELDLEDYGEAITRYQLCCTDIIRRYHGFVARYVGDGVLAYFGYPRAVENDAERAATAGLEIARAVASIQNEGGVTLQARVGIATGQVLISDLIKGRFEVKDTVLGTTPNLAARLQALAKPGAVVISESTKALLGTHIECSYLGSLSLKGFAQPVPVWQVLKAEATASRFKSRQKGPLTPLTGRDEELALLLNRWHAVGERRGRVVLISGEAGIGKSRLVESFFERIGGLDCTRLRLQCSPFHTSSALNPIITHLRRVAGLGARDGSQDQLDRLEALLAQAVDNVEAVAPLFARLLSLRTDGRYRPLDEPPEALNERTKLALLEQIFGLARTKPVVAVFEDIHWIDPSTEELLGALIERIEAQRVLLLCTYRPEYEAPWTGQAGVSTLHLTRLDHRRALEMVRQLSGERDLAPDMAEAIVSRTEGVPLFIEELTRSLLDSDRKTAPPDDETAAPGQSPPTLPSTLNELLMAKLDSLSDSDEVVQICAAIGWTFGFALLSLVSGLPDEKLRATLDKLIRAQIFVQHGRWPDATYSFRHALIQEAAYATMLKSRVKALHARIADTLVREMPEDAVRSPEVVAYHYGRAAMAREARDHWATAADRAIERSAYLEAIAHLEAALQENAKLGDGHERNRTEIALREKLVIPLEARFWGSDDIAANLSRLHELQSAYGDDTDLFAVLDGLYGTHIISGKADLALDYASKMAAIAANKDDAAFAVMSEHAIAMCHFALGEFGDAVAHYAKAMELRPHASAEVIRQYYLAEVEIIDQCMQAWAYVLSGDSERAAAAIARARALTEATDHEFSQAYGFSILASAHQGLGDAAACLGFATRARELSQRQRFRYWDAWARIMQGWAIAAAGDHGTGIEELAAGLEGYVKTGSRQIVTYAKALLADCYLRAGRLTGGLALIEEIESDEETSPVRFHRPVAEAVARRLRATATPGEGNGGS